MFGGASGLWVELSFGFGAQKRARYRGWLDGFGSMFGSRPWMMLLLGFGGQKRALYRGWLEGFGSMSGNRQRGSGLSSRSGLVHRGAPAIGVGWEGSD